MTNQPSNLARPGTPTLRVGFGVRRAALVGVCVGMPLAIGACGSSPDRPRDPAVAIEPDTGPASPSGREDAGQPGPGDRPDPRTPSGQGGGPSAEPAESSDVTLRVHPLTRVATDARSTPAIILHLDARDGYNQAARVRGVLTVQLINVPDTPGDGEPSRSWTIDLSDPARNAALFDDLITRTYTVPLARPPEALLRWAKGDLRLSPPPTLKLRYVPAGPRAGAVTMSAELTR